MRLNELADNPGATKARLRVGRGVKLILLYAVQRRARRRSLKLPAVLSTSPALSRLKLSVLLLKSLLKKLNLLLKRQRRKLKRLKLTESLMILRRSKASALSLKVI